MQAASDAYKRVKKKKYRDNLAFVRVTIGLINQQAQATAFVPNPENYTYYSNLKMPLNNYQVAERYASCEQDYARTDGSMYFLPRTPEDVVLNAGIVSKSLLGAVEVHFPVPFSIKGLTVEFGPSYPVDFTIESNQNTVEITGNDDGHFVTEEIFENATYIRIVPTKMVNGQGRLHIEMINMGIGVYFSGKKILSASKKEHISVISEELPSIDFSLTVENRDRLFDIENSESTVNFLEPGQNVEVLYGLELDDKSTEWLPGATLQLKDWSADDEKMQLSATDRFDYMDETYYRGQYYPEGVSLFDLATDVFQDAGTDVRDYYLDPYLKEVLVCNPIPAVPHKEALQIIANAGRCILYQDRAGKLFMRSSFIPDMEASSANDAYFAHTERILDKSEKESYALTGQNHTPADGSMYFVPRSGTYLNTGYISQAVAGADGSFPENPTVEIDLEAAFKCFGITLEFGQNHPEEMVLHTYLDGVLQEDYLHDDLSQVTVISREFPEFDRLVLEFTRGCPNNRVTLDNVLFGDSTDYWLEYGTELLKTPTGTQLQKVKELQMLRTIYNLSAEEAKELTKETVVIDGKSGQYVFYLTNPGYDLSVSITEPREGEQAKIIEHSAYYALVELTGVNRAVEVAIMGKEYVTSQAKVSRQLNPTGSLEKWENPLVSSVEHAADLVQWVGDYFASDREYNLQYRGEPRIDANDLMFLENKYVPDMLIRVEDHTLNFNAGALSGTIKARRDRSGVVTAKNRLEKR